MRFPSRPRPVRAAGVGDLKRVLSNVKSRGVLGEIQLSAILEDILTPDQYGAVAGAVLIGIAEEMSTLVVPTNYRQAMSFTVILVFLLFRANGLFGRKAISR